MQDVNVGPGALGGRGIYAGRAFDEGEVVVSYRLQRLSREQYLALPEDERLFVHSYWGERWLYPPPARYVNHADTPNTWQDFDRHCDVALRHIDVGEPVTTDARRETGRELETFLEAYERAVGGNDVEKLEGLIDQRARGWVQGRGDVDRAGIIEAVFDAPIGEETGPGLTIRDPEWIIATGRWEAVCSYDAGGLDRARHVTDVLQVVDGNWQLVFRHESPH